MSNRSCSCVSSKNMFFFNGDPPIRGGDGDAGGCACSGRVEVVFIAIGCRSVVDDDEDEDDKTDDEVRGGDDLFVRTGSVAEEAGGGEAASMTMLGDSAPAVDVLA